MSSSTGSGKRVVGEKGEKKDVVSSSPPATRTRAQTRADRAEMNQNIISPRSATVKATIASSGPRGISPRGGSVNEKCSATTRNKLRAGSHSPKLSSPAISPTARSAAIYVACAEDIPAPPPMILSRLKRNPYAGRREHKCTSNVDSAVAVPASRAPTTHAASDTEMLTSTLPATSTTVPFAPRLSYLEVASNAVPTPPKVTTPLSIGSELTSNEPRAPPSPEGKGPAPCREDTASAELAVTSSTGSRQVDPVLVREAARTKAAKEEATASFSLAHAAMVRAEQKH